MAMLRTLTHNAVVQRRYHDAAHHLWLLASEQLGSYGDEMPPRAAQKEFERCRRTSDQYTLAARTEMQLRPVSATPPLTSLLLPLSL